MTPPEEIAYSKQSILELQEYLEDNENIIINSDILTTEKIKELLDPWTWLSSDHINAYFSMLNTKYPQIYVFPSYFYTKLTANQEYNYEGVRRWTKRTCIFDKETVFIPINFSDSHWVLAVLRMHQRKIEIWDSLGGQHHKKSINENINQYLRDEYRDKKRCKNVKTKEFEEWPVKVKFRRGKTPQTDANSCGVFICFFARLLAECYEDDEILDILFNHDVIEHYREVMVTELWERCAIAMFEDYKCLYRNISTRINGKSTKLSINGFTNGQQN
ncbi:16112_t:CDS:2 [Dentiscutata erythropus]|uniref:16112_t:CDS:1 n=1 Tax=Dentiscutata erythropus TaxID=1348616 RepID=A0A9N9DD22_9GLOM|nr:16112_t:CDS:2 [Dentiscutata erythropus]